MANQFPTVYPLGFQGNGFDFNRAKVDRSGSLRLYKGQIAIPSGTPAGSKIGIIPIVKGANVQVNGSSIWADALDTTNTLTASVGVTYNPSSTQTEAPATFVATGATTLRAGGNVLLNQVEAGLYYQTLDSGWITITTAAASTNQAGNINYSIAVAYDAGALS